MLSKKYFFIFNKLGYPKLHTIKAKVNFILTVRFKDCKLRQQFLLLFAALIQWDHERRLQEFFVELHPGKFYTQKYFTIFFGQL